MGAAKALGVYVEWSQRLSPLARLVLIRMALTAKDDHKTPRYWGGRTLLLESMGRPSPHETADHRALARVMHELVSVGAIHREDHARPGHNAVYRLNVMPTGRSDVDDPESVDDPEPGAPW